MFVYFENAAGVGSYDVDVAIGILLDVLETAVFSLGCFGQVQLVQFLLGLWIIENDEVGSTYYLESAGVSSIYFYLNVSDIRGNKLPAMSLQI